MDIVNAGSGPISYQQGQEQDYSYVPEDVAILFIVLSTLVYGVRLWSRRLNRASFGLDDMIMVPAFIVIIALNITSYFGAVYGSGRHFVRVIAETSYNFTDWGIFNVYVIPIIYEFAVTLPKLSVLTLYLRVFRDRWSRGACWFIGFILVANMIAEDITTILQCNHIEYGWELWNEPGNCDNIVAHFTYASIPNLATDVAMLLLPLPAVRKLQLERRAKVGLGITFLLGSLGVVTGALRLAGFVQDESSYDGTWYAGILEVWSMVEANMYFISACLLTYRPLLSLMWRKLGLSRVTSSGRRSPSADSTRRPSAKCSALSADLESGLRSSSTPFDRMEKEADLYSAPTPPRAVYQAGPQIAPRGNTPGIARQPSDAPLPPLPPPSTVLHRPDLARMDRSWLSFSSKISSKFSSSAKGGDSAGERSAWD